MPEASIDEDTYSEILVREIGMRSSAPHGHRASNVKWQHPLAQLLRDGQFWGGARLPIPLHNAPDVLR